MAQGAWGRLFRAAMDAIADCFARRETRMTAAEMVTGLLMEVDTRNCWTLAEALGRPGPHRPQHLLSRASFDHDRAREAITAWSCVNCQARRWCWSRTRRGTRSPRPVVSGPVVSTPER